MKLLVPIAALISVFAISSVYASSGNNQDSICFSNDVLKKQEFVENDVTQVRDSGRYDSSVDNRYREKGRTEFPKRINPPGERIFVFSPRYKGWATYLPDGTRVGYGKANGGSHWCADAGRPCRTPVGSFRVRSKGSPSCKSGKYPLPNGGAPMPYCMFFTSVHAIHGSPGISNQNSSHGCIRVYNQAAKWLSKHFMRPGTRVLVMGY